MENDSRAKIISAYEELAESYNALIDHKPHNAYYDRPSTLALIPEVKGKAILDAACGPGKYAEILLGQGAHVTGFDISPKMVEIARKRNQGAGTFFVHDLATPFDQLADNSFDIVLCALALHYIPDWTLTIQEFHRVLKPEGYLILSLEHPFHDYTYFQSTKYFEVEPVKCTWNGFGKPVEVHSFRRPLMGYISPLTENGFYLDALVEPKPVPEFEKLDPKHFQELNQFPSFMGIRAIRKK
ncbi:class I SAM-dependent methyltransferase [Rufibacter glacialis]|uniref:Class I SAM-dependent methyltransferase n=1 Tax=Rufibacter glacialis TaxID=1259555 RepID=A0A5M8QTW8_9BACT|nr:class I SAM-dependent methyltransferase [Rufibacter glacialis]KAA6438076.1 class I SAM-dependent methyltransferase [Rufibacter glacialis]GGK88336.1 SAM-dependent methyltransferase [Rufibacter glacialis]